MNLKLRNYKLPIGILNINMTASSQDSIGLHYNYKDSVLDLHNIETIFDYMYQAAFLHYPDVFTVKFYTIKQALTVKSSHFFPRAIWNDLNLL